MGYDTNNVREFLESLAGFPYQNHLDDQTFDFIILDGEPRSELIKSWFITQNIDYAVKAYVNSHGLQNCKIRFETRDLAMLFKLSFKVC